MDRLEALQATVKIAVMQSRRRKRKRYWVHPMRHNRKEHGEYHRLVQELRLDNSAFQQYFRLQKRGFDHLLSRMGPQIARRSTALREAIEGGCRGILELHSAMERSLCVIILVVLIFQEVMGFNIRNEQLGQCMQSLGGRLALEECRPGSDLQEWEWRPNTQSLVSVETGECLSVPRALEHESIHLRACGHEGSDEDSQAWSCSKKGHITLLSTKGLHLSAHRDTGKVFLSGERGRISKWKTLENHTICDMPGRPHHWHHHKDETTMKPSDDTSSANPGPLLISTDATHAPDPTESSHEKHTPSLPYSTANPGPDRGLGPSIAPFFSPDNGLGWKVAMLVLTSLALMIGLLVLFLSIHFNRKKKVMCVVKSYTPTREMASQQGSPVPNERAPLTQHPMKPPRSPLLQRGEILIEWKDGTVTPLFDTNILVAD
ncbi:hypothetical protein GJAV_G00027170 [Gymnothorax javanicus]|nr:hypothetical protein GJAV_G00027170 [Gymnothorax javanicus]